MADSGSPMADGGPIEPPRAAAGISLVAAALLLAPARAAAIEIVAVEASHAEQHYQLAIEAVLSATPEQVLAVLTDYTRLHELHPRLRESRSLGSAVTGTDEVYTRFEGCLLLFCRRLSRVELIQRSHEGLLAVDLPGRGSFKEGRTTWRLGPDVHGTRLRYEARFVPDFWVPPLLGPGVLTRSMRQMTLETLAEVERRAGRMDRTTQ
jgi:hypothetical protein